MPTKPKLPKKLEKDTITEAIFEIRFSSTHNSVSDILPGIIYQKFSGIYSKAEKLPLAHFPPQITLTDPNFKYKATAKLFNKHQSILVGNNSVTISNEKPYLGWDKFKERIFKILDVLESTKFVSKVERISVRYTNMLPKNDQGLGENILKFRGELGNLDLHKESVYIKLETVHNDCTLIIQVRSDGIFTYEKNKYKGIMFDIDTIYQQDLSDFWRKRNKYIEHIHNTEKEIFFGILRDETIKEYGPIW